MVHPKTMEFLKGLEDWNNKKFFELYKPLYLKIKEDFENMITSIINKISEFDDSIIGLETKKCTYRIYKDMRFPRNRAEPYKTNIGANMSKGGKNSIFPGYYIHIQNNSSFFGGGVFFIEPKTANIIREYIYKNRKEFNKIINNAEFIKIFGEVISYRPKLKKVPKGFDANHPSILYILNKDRLVSKKLTNKSILSKNLENNILKYAEALQPLNNFLHKALMS